MELWKDIPNFEGLYQASINGEIRSIYKYKKILKQSKSKNGYLKVMLCANGKRKLISVHRLIAMTFLEDYETNLQVNHKNGIKTDNRVDNLEMVTPSENIRHSFENGLQKAKFGKEHPLYKKYGKENKTSKKVNQYDLEGNFIKTFNSIIEASKETNTNRANISACCKGKLNKTNNYIWRYVDIKYRLGGKYERKKISRWLLSIQYKNFKK